MDRGVFIGGGLICASFLLAVLLNESARETRVPEPAESVEVDRAPAECKRVTDAPLGVEAPHEAAHRTSKQPPDRLHCE